MANNTKTFYDINGTPLSIGDKVYFIYHFKQTIDLRIGTIKDIVKSIAYTVVIESNGEEIRLRATNRKVAKIE